MNYKMFIDFLLKNLLFNFTLLPTGVVFAWTLYSRVFFRNTCVSEKMLEKENKAVWIEFAAAFLFPVLFLLSRAAAGPASDKIAFDFLICLVYSIIYILLFMVFKSIASAFIPPVYTETGRSRINLSKEIYNSGSVAAACYSAMMSWIFVNILGFLDIDTDYIMVSLLRISAIIIFTLLGYIVFRLFLHPRVSVHRIIFIDGNTAASIALAGFILSLQYLTGSIISMQTEFSFFLLLLVCAAAFIAYSILSVIMKLILSILIKTGFRREIYLQASIPAAACQCILYAGIALTLVAYVK